MIYERDPDATYMGPFPTDRCCVQFGPQKFRNGTVERVEMTNRGIWITVKFKDIKTRRVRRDLITGWCPVRKEARSK